MPRLSPNDLYNNYRKGFSGCLWEPHVYEQLLENSKYAYFKDGARKIKNSGKGKLSTPYKSVLKFDKNPYNERQTTGDCVSHGTRNACDVSRAVEIDVHRDREAWLARGATEAIYGARGHGGQGMSCARAATFVSETGGILVRKNYEIKKCWKHGFVDVSGCTSSKEGLSYVGKYIMKSASSDSKENITQAMTWYYSKRAYSVSKNFFIVLLKGVCNSSKIPNPNIIFLGCFPRHFVFGFILYDDKPYYRGAWDFSLNWNIVDQSTKVSEIYEKKLKSRLLEG